MSVAVTVHPDSPAAAVFSWHDLCYAVPRPGSKTNESKVLLNAVNGRINAGEMVAIMGGSGAGKSTLLNTLAGRIGPGTLSGDMLVDGEPRRRADWQHICSFVEQDDILYTNLTVYETLSFTASLRLPSSMSAEEKLARVESVIADLGLQGCRDTRIGNSEVRGISGGERKRVSIGIELVTDPQILFLDEPTSGLDAFNAFNVIETIKKLAVSRKMIVLLTIHQPRTSVLDLFDKIVLLSAGRCVWFGPTQDAINHFASLGHPIPDQTNPSDFFLDITTLDQRSDALRQASLARITQFNDAFDVLRKARDGDGEGKGAVSGDVASPEKDANVAAPSSSSSPPPTNGASGATGGSVWPSTWHGELFTLLRRNMVDVSRDKASLGASIGQAIFIVILVGFIFFRISTDNAGVQNRLGVLFFLTINQTFGVVMPTLGLFPIERQIMKRERAAGSYRSSSAYLAKFISTLPLKFAGVLLVAIPIYWMIGLQNNGTKYLIFILILTVHTFAANSIGLMLGSMVPNVTVGQIVGPMVITIFLLFGGTILNLDKVPVVFQWLQWISIIAYTNKALNQNEFTGLVLDPCQPGGVCYGDGPTYLNTFGFSSPTMWVCVIANVAISVMFLVIGYIAFDRTSRPLLRLK